LKPGRRRATEAEVRRKTNESISDLDSHRFAGLADIFQTNVATAATPTP
jgi:hypothetical protein